MHKQECIVWGNGAFFKDNSDVIQEKYAIKLLVDNNSSMWGGKKDVWGGIADIVSPWELRNWKALPIVIAVNSWKGIDSIKEEIRNIFHQFGEEPIIDTSFVERRLSLCMHDLLCKQHDSFYGVDINGTFMLNIVIKLLAVEHHFGGNDYGMYLHRKYVGITQPPLMYEREADFISLMESIDREGYNSKFPITINSHYTVVDGTHRMAVCLYKKLDEIEVRMINSTDEERKNLIWLKKKGVFSTNELDLIISRYKELVKEYQL